MLLPPPLLALLLWHPLASGSQGDSAWIDRLGLPGGGRKRSTNTRQWRWEGRPEHEGGACMVAIRSSGHGSGRYTTVASVAIVRGLHRYYWLAAPVGPRATD